MSMIRELALTGWCYLIIPDAIKKRRRRDGSDQAKQEEKGRPPRKARQPSMPG